MRTKPLKSARVAAANNCKYPWTRAVPYFGDSSKP